MNERRVWWAVVGPLGWVVEIDLQHRQVTAREQSDDLGWYPNAVQVEADLEANKAVVRSFVDAWNTRDFDRFTVLTDDDAVLRIGGVVVPCDLAGTTAIAQQWTTAFPDWHFELKALIAEGDRVVAHMPYVGTHRRAILGIAATQRTCRVDEIVIFRIADGKIAEAWEVYDEAGMWRQLGIVPPLPSE